MSTHPLDIHVEPGNEGYLKWAKLKLADLTTLRKSVGLPTMHKHWSLPGDVLVHLTSAGWADRIRITGGAANGFLLVPSVRRLSPSTVLPLTTGFSPFRVKLATPVDLVKKFGLVSAGMPHESTAVFTPSATPNKYLNNGFLKDTGVTIPFVPPNGVLNHTTPPPPLPAEQVENNMRLVLRNNGDLYAAGSDVPFTTTGSKISPLTWTSDAKARRLVIYGAAAEPVTVDIDGAATHAVWTPYPDALPYGTQRTINHLSTTNNSAPTEGTATRTTSLDVSLNASFPLSKGINAGGLFSDITLTQVINQLTRSFNESTLTLTTFSDDTQTLITTGFSSNSLSDLNTIEINMPGGGSHLFYLSDRSLISSGSSSQGDSGVFLSGSGSYGASEPVVSGTFNVLYIDPSVPIVVYEYAYSNRVSVAGTGQPGSFSWLISVTTTTTGHSELGVLIGAQKIVLEEHTGTPSSSTTNVTVGGYDPAQSNFSSTTDVTTPITSNAFPTVRPRTFGVRSNTVDWGVSSRSYSTAANRAGQWLMTVKETGPDRFKAYASNDTAGERITQEILTYLGTALADPVAQVQVPTNPELYEISATHLPLV